MEANICLPKWSNVSGWVKCLKSPILRGMLHWNHATATRFTGNYINLALSPSEIMRFVTGGMQKNMTENTPILT